MATNTTPKVEIRTQEIGTSIAKDLISKGYVLGDNIGNKGAHLQVVFDGIGILKEKATVEPETSKIWGIFRRSEPQRELADFIGVLWFGENIRGSDKDNWVLEVYGKQHQEEMVKLANNLSSKYGVGVKLDIFPTERKECYSDPRLRSF